ncbi:MAG: HAMP domain-containing histidine kinase [Ignavibacteriales bacterium]|nr:HAMP domain-containing histidine kinase [Ignavibacteriales bacterium]
MNRNKICENCSLEKQFKSYSHSTNNILSENSGKIKLKVKSSECNEIEILDKANNKYFMVEHNTSIFTNAYSTHLGMMTCQDVNFRHEIIELAKNIQEPIKSNEFNEPTRHIKPDEIYNRIINTFKNKLGFNRVRLYLNFSSKRGSANVPILVLVNHIGYDSSRVGIPEVGLKIYFDDLSEKIFKEKGTQNKFSILDYFVDSKYRNLHIFNYGDIAEPDCRVSKLSKKLDLKERWVDVPLWIGEELIGAIGVDYDDDDIKWDMINEDIKFQLMQGSVFLASAIKNSFLINNSVRFTNISRKISELKLAGKKEEELLKLLSEEFDANVVFHFYKFCDYGFKLSSSYSIQESWTKITDSFIYLGDTENCILSKKEGRHFANEKNFENRTELEVHKKENGKLNSVISIYLRSNGKVVAILLGTKYNKNENNLPFSNYDYVFLRSVSEQAGEILHNFYFKQGYDKIIFAVANSISKIERIEDFGVKFFKSIRELYPKTYITLYQKKRGKLILIADSEIKNENKQLAKLVYNLPSESIPNKLQWIKEQESGFTTSFLYREDKVYYYKNRELLNEAIAEYYPKHEKDRIVTYYDAQYEDRKELQSEIIKVIKYKDQPIGIIRFQDNLTDSYDEYFIDFVKTLASQIGNIVGLLNELEERKDFERSFFHELKAPVAAMSGNLNLFPYRMGFSPEEFKQIGLEINNKLPRLNRKRDSRANIEDPDYILIPKNKLFPLLQVLNLRDRLLQFILNDPDIFDVSKPIRYSFKKEVDLKKIVSSICRTLQFNAEKSEDDKKLLFETKKLFSKIIVGDERYLELAFYNIFSNVIKYSLRINGSYVRNILIDWEDHDQIFIIRITNYGKTFSPDESQQVLELEKRGSNSLNIEGKGLGLFLANRIFNSHSALLKLIPYPDEFKTETTITFNLHLNSKLSDET